MDLQSLLPETITLEEGLKEAAEWYFANEQEVRKKDYLKYIDENLRK